MGIYQSLPKEPLTQEEYRRLDWYFYRQNRPGCEVYSMDDTTDCQLKLKGLLVDAGWAKVKVTIEGQEALRLGLPKAGSRPPLDGFTRRLTEMLSREHNLVWEQPCIRLPGENSQSFKPDLFSLHKSLNGDELHPTAYVLKTEQDAVRLRLQSELSLVAEFVYIACPEGFIKMCDIPPNVGLLVELVDGKWLKQKPSTRFKTTVNRDFYMQMVLERKGIKTSLSACA